MALEYDAVLTQHTGEDWNSVPVMLSTSKPTVAANPPEIEPVYVDVQEQEKKRYAQQRMAARTPERQEGVFGDPAAPPRGEDVKQLAADALVTGEGPAITFELPRTVTVPSDSRRTKRTRIASFDLDAEFIHVAVPSLTEAVYIRSKLTNTSEYHLLPGTASIFAEHNYVGSAQLPAIPPGDTFEAHFGIDPTVGVARQLISKETSSTGLFGGGVRTSYKYRIAVNNNTGKGITLEMWERRPVSRSDKIRVEVVDLNRSLATDEAYVQRDKPRGLLKWRLSVPADARGDDPFLVTYGVQINREKSVEMTPLPE